MIKIEIKHRGNDRVLYTTEISGDTPSGMQTRVALEQATAAKANLSGANLRGANLSDAYLSGANLRGAYLSGANLSGANLSGAYLRGAYLHDANLHDANLSGANLSGAYLRGAYLRGAYLSGAYLSGAYLRGANLRGAYLRDAYLRGDLKLAGARPVLMIGPIGSVSRTVFAWITNDGLRIEAGCFFGTRDEFVAQLAGEHGDNEHGREYTAALTLIDAHVEIWTPKEQHELP